MRGEKVNREQRGAQGISMEDTGKLVPFGKYKNQPLAVLAQDTSYVNWLQGQDWFAQRYPSIRTLIINNFGEPEDTPEHNALQARFFDDDFVQRCSIALLEWRQKYCGYLISVGPRLFEVGGNDVFWNVGYWALRKPDKDHGVAEEEYCLPYGRRTIDYAHSVWKPASWMHDSCSIVVECKPTLGDDYPGVLRQMLACNQVGNCLVIERFASRVVSFETVKKFFATRKIFLCTAGELLALPPCPILSREQLPNPIAIYEEWNKYLEGASHV